MGLQSSLQRVLRLVYPPRCIGCDVMVDSDFGLCGSCWRDTPFIGETVCDSCGTQMPGAAMPGEVLTCDSCLLDPPPWQQGRAALRYEDRARQLVLRLKHGDRHDIVQPAALWMAKAAQPMQLDPKTLIVPIPLHWRRLLKRRYNQSALLAQALCANLDLPYGPDVLQRRNATPSLDGRTRAERKEILKNAITVNPKRRSQILGRSILIVDDVMTTGATLAAATQACIDAGAGQIRVLVLARVDKEP